MANVGLVTRSVTPYPRQIAWTSVVFPAPNSPEIATTSGAVAAWPNRSPQATSSGSVRLTPLPAARDGTTWGLTRMHYSPPETVPAPPTTGHPGARPARRRGRRGAHVKQLVTQPRGRLEVERRGRLLHLALQPLDNGGAVAQISQGRRRG